jgi:antitoxin (DNA-binding transcriptional repressor) of toxin-antitoxin stability system
VREIGGFEAKNKLGQLLDLVEQGEEITIAPALRRSTCNAGRKTN